MFLPPHTHSQKISRKAWGGGLQCNFNSQANLHWSLRRSAGDRATGTVSVVPHAGPAQTQQEAEHVRIPTAITSGYITCAHTRVDTGRRASDPGNARPRGEGGGRTDAGPPGSRGPAAGVRRDQRPSQSQRVGKTPRAAPRSLGKRPDAGPGWGRAPRLCPRLGPRRPASLPGGCAGARAPERARRRHAPPAAGRARGRPRGRARRSRGARKCAACLPAGAARSGAGTR